MKEKDKNFPGRTVVVDLGDNSYPIYITWENISRFGRLYQHHCAGQKAIIITDENVAPLYADSFSETLSQIGVRNDRIVVDAGEATKCLKVVEKIYDALFDLAVERSDAIIALGGGVVGDLAGFVAATFKRGVKFVQAPTTLLAMVDSSIGGKTGVNHARGKNMIGSFYQPQLVFADTSVLKTLPRREWGCGLAETVKHAVIRDQEFFNHMENHTEAILDLKEDLMIDLVMRNCQIKASVVAADEKESGLRGILNFGHTIGHTFETVLKDKDYHHGEAVSLGMVAAARLAVQRKLISDEQARRITGLLQKFDLPTKVNYDLPVDRLYEAMRQDKKVKSGKIKFVLPTTLGDCTFVDDLSDDEIKTAIKELKST